MTKEEFEQQKKDEEALMDAFFNQAPPEVQMGGRKAIIAHIAQNTVDLYELQNGKD